MLDLPAQSLKYKTGSPTWTRTRDLRINSPSLYQLSYQGIEFEIITAVVKLVNFILKFLLNCVAQWAARQHGKGIVVLQKFGILLNGQTTRKGNHRAVVGA